MARPRYSPQPTRPIDFFVSYSPADERWATWIAWELEADGYRTMLQAWDFVPGTNFIDFMDRGVSAATIVIAVLSPNYLDSRYGRLEWQAALRADPDNPSTKLVTIRVADCPLEGLLSTITYVDLVGVTDLNEARVLLLNRIRQALAGRAKPANMPSYPHAGKTRDSRTIVGKVLPPEPTAPAPSQPNPRRTPATPPAYPPALATPASQQPVITVLQVAGPRFGRGLVQADAPSTAGDLQARIWGDLTQLAHEGAPQPDLFVVTGDLTESGSVREFDEALTFLTGLRVLLGLEPHRLVVVPGAHDITRPACRAYFANCEADDIEPQEPYWPKWRHYTRLFEELYQGVEGPIFDSEQPWTLFAMPDLHVVIAGLNTTMAESHREDDHYGWLGEAQAAWFAQRLRPFEESGWLRIGVASHLPSIVGSPPADTRLTLRDTATLDRLLGPRLNLFVHGRGGIGSALGNLASGLPAVPPMEPAGHQLLEITADGLTRWAGGPGHEASATGAGRSKTLARRWHAAHGTFPSPAELEGPADAHSDGMAALPGQAPMQPAEPDYEPDPTTLLLDRIAEVCETRYERARIRRIAGAVPHLLVTHREEGFARQLRVCAHVGELTRDVVERFLQHVHATDPDLDSELVYQGPPPPQLLRDEAQRRGVRLRSFTEFQGLLDLRDYVARQTAALRADPRYLPDHYVPQRYRPLVGIDQSVREDLVGELLSQLAVDEARFLLVLGDFGRGKTFALREVARRIPAQLPHLTPILIDLRALDKAHSVDGLVAAHLANHREEVIDLKAFRYMLRQGRIVLLFDGFDELVSRVTYDRAADHLDTLLDAVDEKAKIVVASRTQHFKSHEQVFTALGERVGLLPQRRVLNVEDFTPAQIRTYLLHRYRGDQAATASRFNLISEIGDLLGLAKNPRMLCFIADLEVERLEAVARAKETISAASLYREILGTWLDHEARRTGEMPGSPAGLPLDNLWRAVTTLALRLWESGETFLGLAELTEVADTLSGLASGQLSLLQAAHAMGTGTLLIRTEEGTFGFIHNSVVEWLVANEIASQLDSRVAAPAQLSRRPLSQLTVDFVCDLAYVRNCQQWADLVLTDTNANDIARTNAIKVTQRLRTPKTDLRGASLKGQDLSYRELQDVDLTDADLTDARLVGTNLTGATLRNTRLVGAYLDEAKLVGADLTGADLSRARLLRSDLRDIKLAGSRWWRAALVDVTADPQLPRDPALWGAAVAPGQPVEIAFPPAAVGVSYGFEPGRIPQPVALGCDGGLLAIGSDDGGVLICDTATGQALRVLQGHRGRVYAVAYGPNDAMLVTGASDCTVRLWDPATGRQLRVLEGHRDWVWPIVVDPRGTLVAVGDSSGKVRLWDPQTGQLRRELAGHSSHIWTAVFLEGGAVLASGDSGGSVRLWDTATGEIRRELPSHGNSVYRIAASPDGQLIATADHAGIARIWDAATGWLRHRLAGHSGRAYVIAFHPSGRLLVTGDTDGALRTWDPETGRAVTAMSGHTGAIYGVEFSPDGSVLASGDSDGSVRLWDVATGKLRQDLAGHKGSVWSVTFRPDGGQLTTSSNDGTTRLWDPATGQCRQVLRGHGRRIMSVNFNTDGSMLATSGNDGVVRLWQPATGQRLRELTGTADRLISAVFGPGPLLATASNDGGVYLWNAATGGFERELNVETDHVWAAVFDPEGDVLATANDDDSVRLWYRTTGRGIRTLAGHKGRVRSIAFSPGGELVATGCDDAAVRIWDREGNCRVTLSGHADRVYSVVFSPDGSLLASASNDGTARVWDHRNGEALHTLTRHRGRLWSAAFSPTGTTLATAGDDLVVRLWDPWSGQHLHTLTGHSRRVWSVDFSPSGTLLASGGDDGTVRLWDLTAPAGPTLRVTLLGLPDGWAALAPDGRYKLDGTTSGEFWHLIGMCRFEPGKLDSYLSKVRSLAPEAEF
jgi:WD40 repeat protein/3',5'-cyclic AMP phosphodiesterase CpdA